MKKTAKLDKVQFIKELSRERLGPVSNSKTIQPKVFGPVDCPECEACGYYDDCELCGGEGFIIK